MSESTSQFLQRCLDRVHQGDSSARNDLLQLACGRLERLTRKMLNDYRGVRRWEETGDVLQGALVRLCRALEATAAPTVRDFYRLAALQIRRELIDLARHYYGPQGAGAHHASNTPAEDASVAAAPLYEAADLSREPGRVAVWTEFHRQVEALPDEEREVFDLLFYQGLSQAEAADVLAVTDRTIKRRWQGARLKLHQALGGELPGI
jgi:RNA polymerase sigma-70 factor (ECF subfamily)